MRTASTAALGRWAAVCVLGLVATAASANTGPNDLPSFGVITSVTGSAQFVIDIKSSADAKPERDQRIINVAGVRGVRQDANVIYALERQILGRDVELSNCTRVPLAPDQLSCHVMINMGRSLNPAANLATLLSSWGLAHPTQPLSKTPPAPTSATNTPAPASTPPAPAGPEFKPFTPPPNLRRSTG